MTPTPTSVPTPTPFTIPTETIPSGSGFGGLLANIGGSAQTGLNPSSVNTSAVPPLITPEVQPATAFSAIILWSEILVAVSFILLIGTVIFGLIKKLKSSHGIPKGI
jgi:hypothetical protein